MDHLNGMSVAAVAPEVVPPKVAPSATPTTLRITFSSADLPERLVVTTKAEFLDSPRPDAFGCVESDCHGYIAYREHIPVVARPSP